MSENSGIPAADDGPIGTFDQTNGLGQDEGEDDDSQNMGAGDPIGNPLRPGGQDGAVGDVADGEEPHLDPDEENP